MSKSKIYIKSKIKYHTTLYTPSISSYAWPFYQHVSNTETNSINKNYQDFPPLKNMIRITTKILMSLQETDKNHPVSAIPSIYRER